MKRRDFLKLMGLAGLSVAWPLPTRQAHAQSASYSGPLYVSIAAMGGWDVTSFCDPKVNLQGQPVINHWAESDTAQTIQGSPIAYAPFANNADFFSRFHDDMLVINGIDAQTNSHDVGVRHNWSGRIAPGYPSFASMVAAAHGQDLPLAFINNGGYRETAGLAPYTLIQGPYTLRNLVNANEVPWGGTLYNDDDEIAVIERHQAERLTSQLGRSDLLPREGRGMSALAEARLSREQLAALSDLLPEEFPEPIDKDGNYNYMLQQIDLALICYQAGLTVSCDMISWRFDTHADHDAEQAAGLAELTNAIEYLWDAADALGIADQLRVCVSSDFGRTPMYNDDNGKDHWPIGSALLMQRGAPWGNRVVGATDGGHNALPINPSTLQVDTGSSGVVIQPKHVQDALRRFGGIEQHEVASSFPLDAEPIDFFNPNVST